MLFLVHRALLSTLILTTSLFSKFSLSHARDVSKTQGFSLPISRVPRLRQLVPGYIFSTDVPLTNNREFAYLIDISIGGQKFPVVLDTGSSDLWVVSSDCVVSDCNGVVKYNKTSSASLTMSERPFKLKYLVGSVSGAVAFDTVTFGLFEISSQVIALANVTAGLGLSSTGNSGILGLCFPPIASIPPSSGKTLLENIFSHFDEPNRFFAFKLGRDTGQDNSSFTIGKLDPVITNDTADFNFTPVSQAGANTYNYWKLPIRSLTLNSTAFPLSRSLLPGARDPIAVLDTGTTLILGPTQDVEAFWAAVSQGGATRRNSGTGMWEVRCERGIIVGFVLGEKGNEREYIVHPRDINWREGGSTDGWCLGGVQANDGITSGDWLLGDAFLRNVYVTHHGANSTHPPLIGLLNLTDPNTALSEFRQERGPDPLPPSLDTNSNVSGASSNSAPLYTLSTICGFVGGAVLTTLFRVRCGSMREMVKRRHYRL